MEHPNKEQRDNQAKMLEQLPKELREEHAQIFRLGNAAYIYHSLASEELEPTEEDFEEWLEGLPDNVGTDMKARGFEECRGIFSFTRYVMEKNDIGMDQWMEQNLSEEDYRAYSEMHRKMKERNT
ncbi:hypothetical protein [Sinomicrobium oceani]|uniref:hypothetical protein n=1 Tax=Sinomicrobium oceani TaxID=1150368 RepID=UPI00227D0799|nr:hypothetical protein [Sinomicrobium oceani]